MQNLLLKLGTNMKPTFKINLKEGWTFETTSFKTLIAFLTDSKELDLISLRVEQFENIKAVDGINAALLLRMFEKDNTINKISDIKTYL